MNTENPDQSPRAATDGGTAANTSNRQMRPPCAWSGVLLLVGAYFLLLLNGQVFTNTLVFVACMAGSAILWGPLLLRSRDEDHRRIALYVIFGHVILIILFASGLSELHRRQQEFNDTRSRLRKGGYDQGRADRHVLRTW